MIITLFSTDLVTLSLETVLPIILVVVRFEIVYVGNLVFIFYKLYLKHIFFALEISIYWTFFFSTYSVKI